MTPIHEIDARHWAQPFLPEQQQDATSRIESGSVILLPRLNFLLQPEEARLLSRGMATDSKNISYAPSQGRVKGIQLPDDHRQLLEHMMARFAGCCRALVDNLFPRYKDSLSMGRTSYRPVEILGRATSWRKDDSRLHVDSFPSSPVQGKRILRFFCNINPDGQPRSWRLGGSFQSVAEQFLPAIPAPVWGSRHILKALHITKSERSAYDHYMLQLHDRMKADGVFQDALPQRRFDFPSGSSWLLFTDQIPHAAMNGQHALEQTFYLPIDAMQDESRSPLRIVERLTGRNLVRESN